jgi:PAS domain-containing protein
MSERETEVYGLRKDGTKFPAEKSVSRLEMGDTTVFTAILRDITQRNQAEEALRGSEAQYRELYHGAPIAYISSDAEGIIVQANQRAAELFGYPLDELVGIPLTGLYAATPEGIDKARNILDEKSEASKFPLSSWSTDAPTAGDCGAARRCSSSWTPMATLWQDGAWL